MRTARCLRTCYSRGILYQMGKDYMVDDERPFFQRYFDIEKVDEEPKADEPVTKRAYRRKK